MRVADGDLGAPVRALPEVLDRPPAPVVAALHDERPAGAGRAELGDEGGQRSPAGRGRGPDLGDGRQDGQPRRTTRLGS